MSLRIEETFELRAPVDRVWSYLVDPRQVVDCLPGAELTEVKDAATFLGRVKVKVGPITAAYNGKVTITGRDDVAHVVSMVGEGREAAGSGSAKMTMTSRLASLPTGMTQVQVVADVDIVGKAAQFGRGMIESVNKQLFKQFTECVRTTLEPTVITSNPVDTAAAPASAAIAVPPVVISPPGAPPAPTAAPGGAQRAAARPVKLLPLVARAVLAMIADLVRSARRLLSGGGRHKAT